MNGMPAGAGYEIQQKEAHIMDFDFMNCYWNRRGAAQAKYDEMEAAGWEYNKTTEDTFHRYYRFYNDGDATPRIRGLILHLSPEALKSNREYIDYCRRFEDSVTWRIEIEYRRFKRAQHNPA